jgi:hypothetical protein
MLEHGEPALPAVRGALAPRRWNLAVLVGLRARS